MYSQDKIDNAVKAVETYQARLLRAHPDTVRDSYKFMAKHHDSRMRTLTGLIVAVADERGITL